MKRKPKAISLRSGLDAQLICGQCYEDGEGDIRVMLAVETAEA